MEYPGHHEVREYVFEDEGEGPWTLDEGWKPYSTTREGKVVRIFASRWVRHEKVDAVAWAEATTREAANGRELARTTGT